VIWAKVERPLKVWLNPALSESSRLVRSV